MSLCMMRPSSPALRHGLAIVFNGTSCLRTACCDLSLCRSNGSTKARHKLPPISQQRQIFRRCMATVPTAKSLDDGDAAGNLTRLPHRVYISMGSNVGDRQGFLQDACRRLNGTGTIRVTRTSGLWETEPMYVRNQNFFINGVLEARTSLQPMELLDTLQLIETNVGRRKVIDKGPRSIDLDILLFDGIVMDVPRLTIPHRSLLDRGFVLQPLCELIPNEKSPLTGRSYSDHLEDLPPDTIPPTTRVVLGKSAPPLTPVVPTRATRLMSILNVTPDSFSDGSQYSAQNESHFRDTVRSHIAQGATVIDIGGQSTRPNAEPVTADEECARVVPGIRIIKQVLAEEQLQDEISISVDTYRADVAEEAIRAGAHIINDVSGGLLDPRMLDTVARLECQYILMHMRGDPKTMTSEENLSYPNGLIETIGLELLQRVEHAEAAGIYRWNIILDPGVGFAKNETQNLEILKRLSELRQSPGLTHMPWLVGTSRKGFIGRVTGVTQAKDRGWGTAAAVTASIQGGADIIRVHDVQHMAQVAKMADAIWRR